MSLRTVHASDTARRDDTAVPVLPLTLATLGVLAFLAITVVVARHLPQRSDAPAVSEVVVPKPRVQDAPLRDHARFLEAEHRDLYEIRWVDRDAGRVVVPPQRAADHLLEHGLEGWRDAMEVAP